MYFSFCFCVYSCLFASKKNEVLKRWTKKPHFVAFQIFSDIRKTFFILFCSKLSCDLCKPLTVDRWPLTFANRWPLTVDLWPLTVDLWQLTVDLCKPLTVDLWPLTVDLWPLTVDLCKPFLLLSRFDTQFSPIWNNKKYNLLEPR